MINSLRIQEQLLTICMMLNIFRPHLTLANTALILILKNKAAAAYVVIDIMGTHLPPTCYCLISKLAPQQHDVHNIGVIASQIF